MASSSVDTPRETAVGVESFPHKKIPADFAPLHLQTSPLLPLKLLLQVPVSRSSMKLFLRIFDPFFLFVTSGFKSLACTKDGKVQLEGGWARASIKTAPLS